MDAHEGSVSIGRWRLSNFHFVDDIAVNAEEKEEGDFLVDRLDRTTTRYKMETGPDKVGMMTNIRNDIKREVKIKVQWLESVVNVKYLGSIMSHEGSKPDILSRQQQLFLN